MKQSFVSIGTRLTRAWVSSSIPILGNIFFGPIVGIIANKLFTFLADQTELAVFFNYIDTRVSEQSREFERAALENYKIQKSGTAKERRDAEEALWASFVAFARLTN